MKNLLGWEAALEQLQSGNKRFMEQDLVNHETSQELLDSFAKGQAPHSIVLTCSDSRVSPDTVFDQNLGDIFIIENAGNIVDDTAVGSIQYAVENLNTKLIVVLGHSSCGAVGAASQDLKVEGRLQLIIDKIKPNLKDGQTMDEHCINNAKAMAQELREAKELQFDDIKVVAAYYNVESGNVSFDI